MGEAARSVEATPAEIEAMQQQVREGMRARRAGLQRGQLCGQGEGLSESKCLRSRH